MLSRVAERVYWMVRYLERAEDAARLINVYGDLLLDIPRSTGLSWRDIPPVLGDPGMTGSKRRQPTDRAVLHFLLIDKRNPDSLLMSLTNARENARTTRDLLPAEAWHAVNELHMYATSELVKAVAGRYRSRVLGTLVSRVQEITGLLTGTMSHGTAYQFLLIGRYLERAEMTTRIVDVAAALLMSGREELKVYENTLWVSVLRSLSAYQMYRQHVRRRVYGADVLRFLLKDAEFPRSVVWCMDEIQLASARLPNSGPPVALIRRVRQVLDRTAVESLDFTEVHDFVDQLQQRFAELHNVARTTWFEPDSGTTISS
ncbi:MAG: alpha-E domain-containing protein [Gammaproteobacteria bacterium]